MIEKSAGRHIVAPRREVGINRVCYKEPTRSAWVDQACSIWQGLLFDRFYFFTPGSRWVNGAWAKCQSQCAIKHQFPPRLYNFSKQSPKRLI